MAPRSLMMMALLGSTIAVCAVTVAQATNSTNSTDVGKAIRPTPQVSFYAAYLALKVAYSAFSWAVNLFSLASSTYSVVKDCRQQFNRDDCILASFGLVISAYSTGFKTYSGFTSDNKLRIRGDGIDVHGLWEDEFDTRVSHELHVPLGEHKALLQASMATTNNGTWVRHATRMVDGEETHHLLYRRASAEDLGHPNDGSYHHYRVQDATIGQVLSLAKREERASYKVVTDYLWKHNNHDVWNSFSSDVDSNDMTRKVTKWYQDNRVEAGCMIPTAYVGTHGGSSTIGIDQGVLAYGWNDRAYNFNGNAGNWVNNECHI